MASPLDCIVIGYNESPFDEYESIVRRYGEDTEAYRDLRFSFLDVGGRKVHLHPRAGHTASDLTIELQDPSVVFCGDLVWNAMFPNYVDATPSRLTQAVRLIRQAMQQEGSHAAVKHPRRSAPPIWSSSRPTTLSSSLFHNRLAMLFV